MQTLNIASIAGGALIERVDLEIKKVLDNIADLNTDAKKKRKVVITLFFEGNEDRDCADVDFETKITLVPAKRISTRIAFEHTASGHVVAEELCRGAIIGQVSIDQDTGEVR